MCGNDKRKFGRYQHLKYAVGVSPREASATDLLGFQIALGGEFGGKASCGSEWRESVWHPAEQEVEFRKTEIQPD